VRNFTKIKKTDILRKLQDKESSGAGGDRDTTLDNHAAFTFFFFFFYRFLSFVTKSLDNPLSPPELCLSHLLVKTMLHGWFLLVLLATSQNSLNLKPSAESLVE
jgi:hypothetical protein